MLNYYSIILLGTLKIQTNLLQLATKISWNIPVCSPFKLQQQHQENESYVYTGCTYTFERLLTKWTIQEKRYKVRSRSVLLSQHCGICDFSPNKYLQGLVFHSVPCKMAKFKHHCQKFEALSINLERIFTKCGQSQRDLDMDFSYCMLPAASVA